jgi:hypothetical protein
VLLVLAGGLFAGCSGQTRVATSHDAAIPPDAFNAPAPNRDSSNNLLSDGSPEASTSSDMLPADLNGPTDSGTTSVTPAHWATAIVLQTAGHANVNALAADSAGNVYATGNIVGTASFGSKTVQGASGVPFVAKISPTGSVAWVWSGAAATTSEDTAGLDVALDNTGHVYLVGYFDGYLLAGKDALDPTGGRMFAIKLTTSGQLVWSKTFGKGMSTERATSVVVASTGEIYVGGMSYKGAVFNGISLPEKELSGNIAFLAKLSGSGSFSWVNAYSTGELMDPYLRTIKQDLAIDKNNDLYLTGTYGKQVSFDTVVLTNPTAPAAWSGTGTTYLVKFSAAGQVLWGVTSSNASHTYPTAVAVDAQGQAVVVGVYTEATKFGSIALPATDSVQTSTNTRNLFVVKTDSNGKVAWARHGGGTVEAFAEDVGLDGSGNIYVVGFTTNGATFGKSAFIGLGVQDALVLRLDGSGNVTWSLAGGSSADDWAHAVAVRPDGAIYVGGRYSYYYSMPGTFPHHPTSVGPSASLPAPMSETSNGFVWSVGPPAKIP